MVLPGKPLCTKQKSQGTAGEQLYCPYCFFMALVVFQICLSGSNPVELFHNWIMKPARGVLHREGSRKRNHANSHFAPIYLIIAL
jgi:hypothetical protein